MNNIYKINSNYNSPSNNTNNSLDKKNNNYNYYNYTMDNNRNESYISDESNSKNKIPIRNKIKKNNDRFINNVLTSISNSNSQKKA